MDTSKPLSGVHFFFSDRAKVVAQSVGLVGRTVPTVLPIMALGDAVIFGEQLQVAFRVVDRVHIMGTDPSNTVLAIRLELSTDHPFRPEELL